MPQFCCHVDDMLHLVHYEQSKTQRFAQACAAVPLVFVFVRGFGLALCWDWCRTSISAPNFMSPKKGFICLFRLLQGGGGGCTGNFSHEKISRRIYFAQWPEN